MFNPNDFFDFARNLLRRGGIHQNEALCRSVISRVYYAAFLEAREKIDTINNSFLNHTQYDMHRQVINVLRRRFRAQDASLSDDLFELKTYRIDADYHFNASCCPIEHCNKPRDVNQKATSIDCRDMANNIINRISRLH